MRIDNAVRLRLRLRGHAQNENDPLAIERVLSELYALGLLPTPSRRLPRIPIDLTTTRSPRLTIHTPVFQPSHIHR